MDKPSSPIHKFELRIALETMKDSMPKAAKKYYAVRVGRKGPRIYDSWAEVSFLLGSVETRPLS